MSTEQEREELRAARRAATPIGLNFADSPPASTRVQPDDPAPPVAPAPRVHVPQVAPAPAPRVPHPPLPRVPRLPRAPARAPARRVTLAPVPRLSRLPPPFIPTFRGLRVPRAIERPRLRALAAVSAVLRSVPVYTCDTCDFRCTRALLWDGHAHTEGHVAQANQAGRTFSCEVCACTVATAHDFRRHLAGKKHKRKLQSITG